jgi:hypothetical protein
MCRYATTLVMKLAYGHQIMSDDDEYIKIAENFSYAFGKSGSPGTTPPDFMPFCRFSGSCAMPEADICLVRHIPAWVPGAWWSKHGRAWRFAIHDILNIPFDRVRKQMVSSWLTVIPYHRRGDTGSLSEYRKMGRLSHHSWLHIWRRSRRKEWQPQTTWTISKGQQEQFMQV